MAHGICLELGTAWPGCRERARGCFERLLRRRPGTRCRDLLETQRHHERAREHLPERARCFCRKRREGRDGGRHGSRSLADRLSLRTRADVMWSLGEPGGRSWSGLCPPDGEGITGWWTGPLAWVLVGCRHQGLRMWSERHRALNPPDRDRSSSGRTALRLVASGLRGPGLSGSLSTRESRSLDLRFENWSTDASKTRELRRC